MFTNNLPLREMTHGSRPPASCKECRRLKLKCDRKVPCSSCVRRGCASICPTGQMVAKGTRFILSNTEELHAKIDTLISRIHSLEGALETSHSLHAGESHPLLRDELRSLATPMGSATSPPEENAKEEELADAIGTLTLEGYGSRYFGSTGVFTSLWNDGVGRGGLGNSQTGNKDGLLTALAGLPLELAHMAHSFPIRIPINEDAPRLSAWMIDNCLPSYEEAWSLFENYWEHYAWHSTPFTRTSFVEQILSPLYHRVPDPGDKPMGHRIALLFMVFAIGQFMDFTRPFDISNGQRYYMLARASLCLEPVFENPTVTALQAMYLIGIYLVMSRGASVPEHSWILSGINTKLALTLGLQHDATKFNLPPVEVEARQQVMVSVICYETWQSLVVGRQPSYTFANFNWLLSKSSDEKLSPDSPLISPRYTPFFLRDCVGLVMDSTRETRYSVILKTDAKIRDYPVPDPPRALTEDPGEAPGIGLLMQQTSVGILKEISLLFLHRRFFALALARSPSDPLKSPFAHSVLACYRSTVIILTRIRSIHAVSSDMIQRTWFIWPNVFVATLVLGSIVARSPGCSLASSALLEFELVCQLWESVSDCVCGPKVLETVRKLKDKAFMAFSQNKASRTQFNKLSGGVEVDDEIAALGGDGPRIITSSSSKIPVVSSTHSPGKANTFTPITNDPISEFAASPFPEYPDMSYPINPYELNNIDFSTQFPDLTVEKLGTDFDDILQSMTAPVPAQVTPGGSSVLEELGLSGGWQPVMDDLGL